MMSGHMHGFSLFSTLCSGVLVVLLVVALIKRNIHHSTIKGDMTKEYVIKGMNCPHCQAAVAKSISGVEGVEHVDVNLSTGIATVEGTHSAEALVEAVRGAGFDVEKS